MHRRRAEKDEDAARLRRLHDVRDEIAPQNAVPHALELAAGSSSAIRAKFGRPARLRISRQAVDAGPPALLGEVAHELAHLADPNERRDRALALLAALPIGVWLAALTVVTYPSQGSPATTAVAVSIAGWPASAVAAWWFARVNHRVELRADRDAAKLLGSTTPVLAMLERFAHLDEQRSRTDRFFTRLTHPEPARRAGALQALERCDTRSHCAGASRS